MNLLRRHLAFVYDSDSVCHGFLLSKCCLDNAVQSVLCQRRCSENRLYLCATASANDDLVLDDTIFSELTRIRREATTTQH